MQENLRSEESQIQIFLNGERLVGKKVRTTDFSIDPGIALDEQEYAGEAGTHLSTTMKAATVEISAHVLRPIWSVLVDFEVKRALGEASGQIDIHVTNRFRNGERERLKVVDCFLDNPKRTHSGQKPVEDSYTFKGTYIPA